MTASLLVFEPLLVRRADLLAEARLLLSRCEANGGGLVVLAGPAGNGKTTLARELRAQVERESTGRGQVPMIMTTGEKLEPALGVWSRLAAVTNSADLMAPEVLLNGAAAKLSMSRRYAAVRELLRRIAISGIPLVVLDDLHAGDQASLIVLSQLVELLPSVGVVILATSRGSGVMEDERARAAHEVLDHHGEVVEVPAFTIDEVCERMELSGAPAEWCARRASLVHELSGGSPLIVDRVVSQIFVRPGTATIDFENWVFDQVDQSVMGIWSTTVSALSPPQQRVLRIVAEVGDLADKALIMGVTLSTSEEVKKVTDLLMGRGLIEQLPLSPCYRVAHPGIAEALEMMATATNGSLDGAELSPQDHLRFARILADRRDPTDPRLIARHLQRAGDLVEPSELEETARRAVAHAVQWGDRAAEAEAWMMVLEARPDRHGADGGSLRDRLSAARALRASGDEIRGRQFAYEVAARTEESDPLIFAEAVLLAADGAEFHGDALQLVGMLRRAHDLIEGLSDQQMLQIEVLSALSQLEMTVPVEAERPPVAVDPEQADLEPMARWSWVTQPEVAQPRTVAAEELAERIGDPEVMARVGLVWRLAHLSPEYAAERWERSQRAHRVVTSHADQGQAVCAVLSDVWERGDRVAIDARMAELADLVAQTGNPRLRWRYLVAKSGLARVSGDLAGAESASVEAGIQGAVAGVHATVLVRIEQRSLYEVDRLEGTDMVRGLIEAISTVQHPPLLGGVLSLAGDLMRAGVAGVQVSKRDLRDLVERLASPVAQEQNWMMASAFAANATAACQDPVAAAGLITLLSPYADRVARESWGAASEGSVARLLGALYGVVGDVSAAKEMFEAGVELDRTAGFHRAVLIGTLDRVEFEMASELVDPAEAVVTASGVALDAQRRGMLAIAARAERSVIGW